MGNTTIQSILHINEKAGQFGGTEEYIESLAKLLSPIGISSHLIYDQLHGKMTKNMASSTRISGLSDRQGNKGIGRKVLEAVSQINPDVVYVHNIFEHEIMQSLDIPDRNYKILWYVHDHYPTCLTELRAINAMPESICRAALSENCLSNITEGYCIKRHAERYFSNEALSARIALLDTMQYADAIIVVSEFMQETLIKNLPSIASKTYVLPRQVRIRGTQIAAGHVSKNSKTWVVVYSGRITYEKGLHLAISALSQLQTDREILFKIAGPAETSDYWSHCLDLAQQAEFDNPFLKIQYEGHLSYERIDALYAAADIVVIPSLWGEPLGTVAGEALVNGAAVIAYNVGGISTFIQHEKTGILVAPNDILALTDAFMKLLSDDKYRHSLIEAGQQLILNQFTGNTHLQALSRLL
ncbi:MAG: glycosyltransferase [Gammaproteobacteria bacterium]|nr:glycosyltransferase [Gammaproteobacteria bacterium]